MVDQQADLRQSRDAPVEQQTLEGGRQPVGAEVRVARLRVFAEATLESGIASVIACVLVALLLRYTAPTPALLAWVAACVSASALFMYYGWRFVRSSDQSRALSAWNAGAVLVSALLGISWAAVLIVVALYSDSREMVILAFVMGALTFGANSLAGFYLPAYVGFAVPMLSGTTAWAAFVAPDRLALLAVFFGFGAAVMLRAGVQATRVLQDALSLGQERAAWARSAGEERERLRVILKAIGDGVIATDVGGRVQYLNTAAERLTGWASEAARGRSLAEVLCPDGDSDGGVAALVGDCAEHKAAQSLPGEYQIAHRAGGTRSAVQLKASPIMDETQGLVGVVVVLHDVTALTGLAAAMSYQAEHDSLTGLPNRKAFEACLAEVIGYASDKGPGHAICYLDLDQFKIINDTCGHAAGDQLLVQLARLFSARIRDTDVLARLGGDEFGILLYRCRLDKARRIADSLCAVVRDFRFHWDGQVFNIGVSIGVVPVDPTRTPARHMAAADAACYVAKDQGRNRVYIVHADDAEVAIRHDEMQLTSHVQRALDDGLFRLRYQKIVPLTPGGELEAEFLVSMLSASGELLPPGVFLPAAERFNMMAKLDRHVLKLAFEHIAGERAELADIKSFAINLSGQSLADEDFLPYVLDLMAETKIEPRKLCFEITETAVIGHMERALRFIETLRAKGCRFALDDFGSGLSSFGYLKTLPVDLLKIDGQFVRNMCRDPIDLSMVEAIQKVGHVMGLKIVAEFVEDDATAARLREMGVDYAQGWALHKPQLLEPAHAATPRSPAQSAG